MIEMYITVYVIFFCATRPSYVNISEVLLMPVDQASATLVNRQV